nr:hypothetical protein [Tanacetum cinerariifolium]
MSPSPPPQPQKGCSYGNNSNKGGVCFRFAAGVFVYGLVLLTPIKGVHLGVSPKEFIFENSDTAIESFSPSSILVEDSNSLRDEIDLSLTPDDSMPPGIKNDDYDSEGDILILEELLSNDSLSLPENESFYFDIPLSPRPPGKPP